MSITAPNWVTPHGVLAEVKANSPLNIGLQALGAAKYAIEGGALPDGVALTQCGSLSGIPTQPTLAEFIVSACNGISRSCRTFRISVTA
jgi:hypothetical protein